MTTPITLKDGRQVLLVKHPKTTAALKAGAITPEKAAGAPWYVRLKDPATGRRTYHSLGTADLAEASRAAGRELAQAANTTRYQEFRSFVQRRASLTVSSLATDYIAASCPDRHGRPRSGRPLANVLPFLNTALTWWGPRSIAALQPSDVSRYADTRAPHARSAQLEVNALRNLFRWGIRQGRLQQLPLRDAPPIARNVRHCHQDMPADADELHRIVAWLMARPESVSYGAALLFQAITGLRPGETGSLRWDAPAGQPGSRTTSSVEGLPVEWLHIRRTKNGINPAVQVRPALDAFLRAWRAYHAATWPASPCLFPHPDDPNRPAVDPGHSKNSHLSRWLNKATAALKLPRRRPHAMRAYYVRVRRSMGALDSTIASELGERTGERLVVDSYGDGASIRGDNRASWLPLHIPPAWETLTTQQPSNIIAL